MDSLPTWEKFSSGPEVVKTFAQRIHHKTVLITGVSPQGLGGAAAKTVAAEKPATLVLTYRSEEKVTPLLDDIGSNHPEVKVIGVKIDLSDLESCRQAANEVNKSIDQPDIIINNAAVFGVQKRTLTSYGVELTFGTNHVGPFFLTNLLIDKVRAAAAKNSPGDTRIVNVSAGLLHVSAIRWDDLNFDGKPIPLEQEIHRATLKQIGWPYESVYVPEAAYIQSKTANALFSVYLNEHLRQAGVLSFAVHPGVIITELGRNWSDEKKEELIKSGIFDKTPDQGVAGMMIAAFDPRLTAEGERYIYEDN